MSTSRSPVFDGPLPDLLPDGAIRREALDPARSFIVQAPAGAGKTGLLIQRFLVLLTEVRFPESVVAITFTRKAAAEMRHRVIAALESATGPEPAGEHERETWRLALRARDRDQALGWHLVEDPSRLRIQTIDSLSAALVRQMPWVSGMGARVETDERVRYLYRRAARRTLDSLNEEARAHPRRTAAVRVLTHLDNRVSRAEELLAGMLEKRDQWLRHVVAARETDFLRHRFESVLGDIIGEELAGIADLYPAHIRARTVESARFGARQLLERGLDSPLVACADLGSMPAATPEGLAAWLGIRELLLTREGKRRRTLTLRQGFPSTPEGRIHKAEALGIELEDALIARIHGIGFLPPARHDDEEWSTLESLLELLPAAAAHLRLVFRSEGRVDFTEVAQAAHAALGSPDRPTGLAFSLDGQLRHLLVDEFQDTSPSQFGLLATLTADWQPGDGRTLFLVGDPMQSIYGFRDADVALFMKARETGVGAVRLDALTLSANFRSTPGIVEWVNSALGPGFSARDDRLRGAVRYFPSVACRSAAGTEPGEPSVEVHASVEDDPESEAARVIGIVRASREENPGGSIAVLVSARRHLSEIVTALRREGVRFEAREIDALASRPLVVDLLALTRALVDPADRVSWLSVLRAPWCGLKLTDLDWIVGGDTESAIWDLIGRRLNGEGGSEDGRRRLERVHAVLAGTLAARGTMPLRRWVEATWLALGGPGAAHGPADLEDASGFLDLLARAAPGATIRDEERFIEAIGALFAEAEMQREAGSEESGGQAPIQLLTIHKAKGLEFDTVILPGLGRTTRSEPSPLLSWLEYVDREGSARLLLAPIREAGGSRPRAPEGAISRYLERLGRERRDHETTRLMYVAATRARRRLHLLGHVRPSGGEPRVRPPARSLLSRVWEAVESEFGAVTGDGRNPGLAEAARARLSGGSFRRLRSDWTVPEPPRSDMDGRSLPANAANAAVDTVDGPRRHPTFDWATDLQRRVGIVVHAMLRRMAGETRPEWTGEMVRAALASEGVGGDWMDEALRRVETALRNTVADERGRWVLGEHEEDESEFAVSCLVGGRVRRFVLDRTFVEGGWRWIIDYKTGTHGGADVEAFLDNEQARYRAQLEDYARAIRSIDPRPVRLGLYFPLLRGWREWSSAVPGGGSPQPL